MSILRKIDGVLLFPTLALVGLGLLSIFSATHTGIGASFQKQVFWAVLGLLLIGLILYAPQRFFHYSAWLLYLIGIGLLVLVLLFGKTVGGNAGWFGIGSFGIQPAEFAKITTVLALARFLSDSATNVHTLRDIARAFGLVFVPWILILLQPDFGTGIVYWVFFVAMLFWTGAPLVLLLALISPILVSVIAVMNIWLLILTSLAISVVYFFKRRLLGMALFFFAFNLSVGFGVFYLYDHLPQYQRERIAVFMDPSRAPRTSGYNVVQSKVAIGSGGLTGKGYLQGSQTQLRFVPEQYTDFIFCVPAEEFGFLGALGVLSLFGILFFRGFQLATRTVFRFSGLVIVGLVTILVFHTFTNIGMTVGLLPVVGIPLPFMSYGGSFFLTSMIIIGILLHTRIHGLDEE